MSRAADHGIDETDRDERLGEAIESYLALLETDEAIDPERFAARYPDLEDDLKAALDGLELVKGLVGSSSGPGPGHGLESGRRVAGYKIVRELGRGGMGIVYEAVHVGLDRPVALKVLGSSAAPDSSGRRRFLNEAKTAAGLHHTHIVPVFDVGQVGGLCYFAMQRIEGSGLDRVIKHLRRDRSIAAGSNPPGRVPKEAPTTTALSNFGSTATWGGPNPNMLSKRERAFGNPSLPSELQDEPTPFVPPRGSAYYRWVASLGRQAADALAHAHAQGVIHRDVKPSNLLVDSRGMIWMADFGLARRLADPSQTQVDSLLGTPRYMSPEQAKSGPIDGRADVYSLGATLYELLTLRPPFDGKTAAELIDQITHREPISPRASDRRIPRDLETIVLKALAKRPADRYATAEEFADDLARFLNHEPVKARRISPIGRAWRVARRHPSLTIVSTVAALAIVAVTTTAYYRVVAERDEAIRARRLVQESALKIESANLATRAALRNQLYQQARVQRLSGVANRRATGLDLLRQAAGLEPDEILRTKLRDEAMALLSLRDVTARNTLEIERVTGLAAVDDGRIAVVSDGEEGSTFQLWDVAKGEPIGKAFELGETRPEFGVGPNGGLGRGGRGPSRGTPFGFGFGFGRGLPRIILVGSKVAAVWPSGRGIRFFDAQSGEIEGDLPLEGWTILGIAPVGNTRRVVTVERQPIDPSAMGPSLGGGSGFGRDRMSRPYRINLWNLDKPSAQPITLAVSRSDPNAGTPDSQRASFGSMPPLVAVSASGSRIATAWPPPFDPEITVFDRDGKKVETIDPQANLSALAIGPHDMIAAAINGAVQVWEPGGKSPRSTLSTHQSIISHLRFSPDDRGLLAVGGLGFGSGVELWDLTTPSLMAILPKAESVGDITFTPGGKSLAVASNDAISVWSIMDPAAQINVSAPGRLTRVDYGTDGRVLISTEEGPRLWKAGDCTIVGGEDIKLGPCTAAFDSSGNLITINSSHISWIDPSSRRVIREVPLPPTRDRGSFRPSIGQSIAKTPDREFVAFLRLNEILAWSSHDPSHIRKIVVQEPDGPRSGSGRPNRNGPGGPGPQQPFWTAIAASPDASRLYLLSRGEFRAYELDEPRTGNRAIRIPWKIPGDGSFSAMSLRGDGRFVALGDGKGVVTILSTRNGQIIDRLEPPDGDGAQRIFSIAYSPDGQELAVGTRDYVRLWSIGEQRRPEALVRLDGYRGFITSLTFDPTGRRIIGGGASDKVVKIWDLSQIRGEFAKLGLAWSRSSL